MAWCLQCGVKHELNQAVGVDEDGEPACKMHQVKAASLNQPEKSKAMNEQKPCPGYGQPCTAVIGSKKELCTRCYARRFYAKSRSAAKAAKKVPKKSHEKKVEKASVATVASISTDCDLAALRAKLVRDLEAVDAVLALLSKAS